jgi:ubiquinone/menaquinone biosynthesis C-methylase UbiE
MPARQRRVHPNPFRGRINAAFFSLMDWYMHWKYGARKAALFKDLPETVVELGAGAGANFRYLRPGTRVIAVEPNDYFHASLSRSARRWGIELEIRTTGAEALDLADASVDAVISSLVLCTVADPQRVVAEVMRVLRPGGRLVCIEHVAAPAGSFLGRLQRWLFRPWRWFFEGCHTHRDTASTLLRAGFDEVAVQPFTWRSVFLPVRTQIEAVCVRGPRRPAREDAGTADHAAAA